MLRRAGVLLPTFVAVAVALAACANDIGIDGTGIDGQNPNGQNAVAAPNGQGGQCTPADAGAPKIVDPSSFPACDNPACAGAHCLPSTLVPAGNQKQLATCAGGLCVPDALIRSGGAKPPSCASLNNADGVCLSVCVPQVAEYKDALPRASCATDERCAPCINPLNGQPSGACEIGAGGGGVSCTAADGGGTSSSSTSSPAASAECPHKGAPVLDPNTLPACGGAGSGAHCLQAALVPAAMVAQLATCPGGYCVPDKFIAAGGNYIPATCSSTGGGEGRCTNTVIPQVSVQPNLPQGTCDANERCAPCTNPIDGKDTGACRLSCDPGPKGPPVVFKNCCSKGGAPRGKCVPRASVPTDQQKNLADRDCDDPPEPPHPVPGQPPPPPPPPPDQSAHLCVPTENLEPNFHPAPCTGNIALVGDYTGVCLSDCVDFGIAGIALDQGSCDDIHTCAPCKDPMSGDPTGAPGCP